MKVCFDLILAEKKAEKNNLREDDGRIAIDLLGAFIDAFDEGRWDVAVFSNLFESWLKQKMKINFCEIMTKTKVCFDFI